MTETPTLFLLIVFVAAASLAFGLAWLVLRGEAVRTRLRDVVGRSTGRPAAAPAETWQVKAAAVAAPLARLAMPDEGWDKSGLRVRFMNAGIRSGSAPVLYFGAKAGLAIALPAVFMAYMGVSTVPVGLNGVLLTMLLLASLGYYLPNVLLRQAVSSYQRRIFEAFPDAIDLIIVCIEAGLGLDAAIARAAGEIRLRSPELADELELVSMELRVGATRERALRSLAMRTGLDEVAALVTMLVQADRFGTSIAESLRVHADGLRTRRRLRAEEAAAKIPLKILFPVIFCIFPSLMIVLMGPAVVSVYRTLLPMMTGR